MGAYEFIVPRIEKLLGAKLHFVGRAPAASPATGASTIYKREQAEILSRVFSNE